MEAGGTVLYNPNAYVFHKVPKARMGITYFKQRHKDGAYSSLAMAARTENERIINNRPNARRATGNWLSKIWENIIKPPLRVLLRPLLVRKEILRGILSQTLKAYDFEMSIYRSSLEGQKNFFEENDSKD
jgi:hypothetical protein